MKFKIIISLTLILFTAVLFAGHGRISEVRDRQFVEAASKGQLLKMQFLRLLGTHVNVYPKSKLPAMVAAAWEGQNDCLEYLLENGGDINIKDKTGLTALMAASYNGHIETVKLLLSGGANIYAESIDGTALSIALEKNQQEIASLLREHAEKNACKAPPLISGEQAICHARWHMRMISESSQHGYALSVEPLPRSWRITSRENRRNGTQWSMELDRKDAAVIKMEKVR